MDPCTFLSANGTVPRVPPGRAPGGAQGRTVPPQPFGSRLQISIFVIDLVSCFLETSFPLGRKEAASSLVRHATCEGSLQCALGHISVRAVARGPARSVRVEIADTSPSGCAGEILFSPPPHATPCGVRRRGGAYIDGGLPHDGLGCSLAVA